MQQILRQLIETEKIDAEIDRLDGLLAAIPAEHQRIADEVEKAEQLVAEEHRVLETEELEERRLESKMRDQEALILRLNHQTAQVSSNQAYTALQHELDAAEASKTEFETLALEHMEAIDRAKQTLAIAQEQLLELETQRPKKTNVIDTRREGFEAEIASIPGTRLIPLGTLESSLAELEAWRERPLVVHCQTGGRSRKACELLISRGFTKVENLAGGIAAWSETVAAEQEGRS